jgi:L-threonylcarbamoyladenylate synthase
LRWGEVAELIGDDWDHAASLIKAGGLVVFPTDTVYGLGCDARNPQAIAAVYDAKGRDAQKAIPLLLSGPESLPAVATSVSEAAYRLAERFWPGGLTIVVGRHPSLPDILSQGKTIAVRVPDHDELREMIRRCGGAIAATSANISGQPDALDAKSARRYLGDRVSMVVDGGRVRGGTPSTVVDCTVVPPRVLRQGALSEEVLLDALARGGE